MVLRSIVGTITQYDAGALWKCQRPGFLALSSTLLRSLKRQYDIHLRVETAAVFLLQIDLKRILRGVIFKFSPQKPLHELSASSFLRENHLRCVSCSYSATMIYRVPAATFSCSCVGSLNAAMMMQPMMQPSFEVTPGVIDEAAFITTPEVIR